MGFGAVIRGQLLEVRETEMKWLIVEDSLRVECEEVETE